MGFGTVFGDLCGSFAKRRFNVERGKPFPVLDQLDYVLGVIFILWIVWSPIPVTISLYLGHYMFLEILWHINSETKNLGIRVAEKKQISCKRIFAKYFKGIQR